MPNSTAARRRELLFILLTVALDAVGIGILIPVMPKLLLDLSGLGVQHASVLAGWLTAVFALVQFVAAPVLGALSDRFGRRPVLLVSLAAFGVSYGIMAIAPNLAWVFLAQALTGLFGATPSTAGAFIADVTLPEERTRRFGSMAAAFGSGLVIGPALGGLLVDLGTRVPFFASATLSLVTVAYGYFVLPESLPHDRRRAFAWRRANPLGAMSEVRRVGGVSRFLAALLLQRIATQTLPAIWPFFTMATLGWTPRNVGYSLAGYGLVVIFIQTWLIGKIDRRVGSQITASAALLLLAVGYLGMAFGHAVPQIGQWIVIACVPLTALGFMAGPTLTSLLSSAVSSDAQGTLQGVIASLNCVAAVLTPLTMPWVFSAFSSGGRYSLPGMPFLISAVLSIAGLLILRPRSIGAVEGARAR